MIERWGNSTGNFETEGREYAVLFGMIQNRGPWWKAPKGEEKKWISTGRDWKRFGRKDREKK